MSIKNKISENIYEVYVESYPEKISLKLYRGDFFSFTLIGFNYDDSSFDFSVYDSFQASIRLGNAYGEDQAEYTFSADEIVLGKVNSTTNIYDELHCVSSEALNFVLNSNFSKGWMDIEGIINEEHKTFIKIFLIVETDVTR